MQINRLHKFLLRFGLYRAYSRDKEAYKILTGTKYSQEEMAQARHNDRREAAKLCLENLRSAKIDRNSSVSFIRSDLGIIHDALHSGWSYEDLETTADELSFFRSGECYKDAFQRCLEDARRNPASKGYGVLEGIALLERLGLTPQDFDTSLEEMRELWWQADRASALEHITKLREIADGTLPLLPYNNPQQTYTTLCNNFLHQTSRDFGLGIIRPITFDDVGTTQTKLDQLLHKGKLRWADTGTL